MHKPYNYNDDHHKVHAHEAEWCKSLQSCCGQLEVITYSIMSVNPNWQMPPRNFSQHVFYYMIDQEVIGDINGKQIHLKPHSLMWIAPNTPHQLQLKHPNKAFSMYNFRFKYWKGKKAISFAKDFYLIDQAGDHLQVVDLLFDELFNQHQQRDQRLQHILALLYSNISHTQQELTHGGLNNRQQSLLNRYMELHCKSRPSIDDLAQVVDLSTDYFRRLFKQTFRISPREWIVRKRMQHSALSLIDAPSRSISHIAADYGYDDIYLFSRQFKKVFAMSPSQYRAQH